MRSLGNRETGVPDRGADALAALSHGGVGKADGRERWEPTGDVDLDAHERGLDSDERRGEHASQHGVRSWARAGMPSMSGMPDVTEAIRRRRSGV
jgi:hypothetical protein